jgi:hypothetical protein
LRREKPWLWEIGSDDPPAFWATVAVPDLRAARDEKAAALDAMQVCRGVIADEMPEMLDAWRTAEPVFSDVVPQSRDAPGPAVLPLRVPAGRTDWHALYCGITRGWTGLNGLRNRRRIWTHIVEIVKRIASDRAAGKIRDYGEAELWGHPVPDSE